MKIIWMPRGPRPPTALLLWKRRIAERVNKLMEREGLSIRELAFRAGLPIAFVKRITAGKFYPGHKARLLLARALRTTTRYLES